jgi:VWFA-related protein
MRATRSWSVLAGLASAVTLAAGQQTTPTFRAIADAVTVPVSVREKNQPVAGLTARDFELTDNGVRQEVATASIASVPIDVTLILDTSGSVEGPALAQFKRDVQTMSDLLETVDQIRLITFSDTVSDVFGLKPAGTRLPVDAITAGGLTQFYTALAAAMVAVSTNERPQLMLAFTDGHDSQSFEGADRVAALAVSSNAALDIVLADSTSTLEQGTVRANLKGTGEVYTSHGAFAGGPNRGALRTAVQRTGGTLYERPAGESLPAIFQKLLNDFRTGYVLAYSPAGVSRGGWHDIQVHCRNPAYAVRARAGYDGGR